MQVTLKGALSQQFTHVLHSYPIHDDFSKSAQMILFYLEEWAAILFGLYTLSI